MNSDDFTGFRKEKNQASLVATWLNVDQNGDSQNYQAHAPMLNNLRQYSSAPSGLAKLFCLTVFIVSSFAWSNPSIANDSTERLRTSVARMNGWLGSGTNARNWRKILDLNVLDSQTAKGEQADTATLRSILARFEQPHSSLQHPVFEEVRSAIREQIAQIEKVQTSNFIDLHFAVRHSIGSFKKPEAADLENQRDTARRELETLKETYRRDLEPGVRAEFFHDSKLDEMIAFLAELQIEMPPEVSVGKMNSMIADERKRLEEVTDKIDAMPVESPEEDADEDESDNIDIEVTPPVPDSSDEEDLKSLEARKDAIENRIKELRKKGREIMKTDRPRLVRRRDNGVELRRIQRSLRKFSRKQLDPAFYAAKLAVDRFADAYIYGTEDNIQQDYLEKVTELANLLHRLDDPNATLAHAQIGNILHWLESRQQLTDLCVAIRRRYSNPNAYVSVSSRMIQGLTTRNSSESDCIAEDFLGRFARGTSLTTTNVNLYPINNPNQVQVSITLTGTASTDTYIRERSFRVDSLASGHLSAHRDLFGNLNGIFATSASADANMCTQFDGISSNCRLIQRIARKSFEKEQSKANAESSRRVRNRLYDRFVSETATVIDDAANEVESYSAKARDFASLIPQVYFRSFSQRIEAVAKKDTRFALGSTSQPMFQTAGSDVQLKLHESMLSNYLDLVFAGRSFTKADFEEELESLGISDDLFAPGEDGKEVEDFKITFPEVRPVQLLFKDNRIGVQITGSRFEQGENSIKTNVTIDLKARVVSRNGKLLIKLEGPPEIDFAQGQEPDAESIAFVKILEERLADAFKASPEVSYELPPNLIPAIDNPQLSGVLSSMHLGLLELNDGWLYLGWNWQGGIVNTPAVWNELVIEDMNPLYLEDALQSPVESVEESSVLIGEPLLEADTSSDASSTAPAENK